MITGTPAAPGFFPALVRRKRQQGRKTPTAGLWAVAIVLLLTPLVLLRWPEHSGTQICTACGMRRDAFDLRTRIGQHTVHQFETLSPTAVNTVLTEAGLLAAHRHDWADGTPTHPGVHETEPSSGLADLVEAPRVVAFLRDLARFSDAASLERWRRTMLDPTYGSVADASLHYLRFPADGFADAAVFRGWWQRSQFALWNRLREETEED